MVTAAVAGGVAGGGALPLGASLLSPLPPPLPRPLGAPRPPGEPRPPGDPRPPGLPRPPRPPEPAPSTGAFPPEVPAAVEPLLAAAFAFCGGGEKRNWFQRQRWSYFSLRYSGGVLRGMGRGSSPEDVQVDLPSNVVSKNTGQRIYIYI